MRHIVDAPIYSALLANLDAFTLFSYLSAENGPGATFSWSPMGLGRHEDGRDASSQKLARHS